MNDFGTFLLDAAGLYVLAAAACVAVDLVPALRKDPVSEGGEDE